MSGQFDESEEPEPNMLHELKLKETERRVFAIFSRINMPGAFISEVGQEVLDTFGAAWNEITTPSWGDRAIYWTHVPVSCMEPGATKGRGVDRPYILNERRVGWFLLTPDDLTVLRMEIALAGDTFTETSLRDGSSWFTQMADRLADIRVHDRDGRPTTAVNSVPSRRDELDPTDALQYALAVLPARVSGSLKDTILKLQTSIQVGKDEISSLKSQVRQLEELKKKAEDAEKAKQLRFLQGGLPAEPRQEPRLGDLMRKLVEKKAEEKKQKEDQTLEGFRKAMELDPGRSTLTEQMVASPETFKLNE